MGSSSSGWLCCLCRRALCGARPREAAARSARPRAAAPPPPRPAPHLPRRQQGLIHLLLQLPVVVQLALLQGVEPTLLFLLLVLAGREATLRVQVRQGGGVQVAVLVWAGRRRTERSARGNPRPVCPGLMSSPRRAGMAHAARWRRNLPQRGPEQCPAWGRSQPAQSLQEGQVAAQPCLRPPAHLLPLRSPLWAYPARPGTAQWALPRWAHPPHPPPSAGRGSSVLQGPR